MAFYEYKVVPAPAKGQKAKKLRQPIDRYALALSTVMNEMAGEGWEYVRAESLPSEERTGLTKRSVVTHNLLVFRRELFEDIDDDEGHEEINAPVYHDPTPEPHLPQNFDVAPTRSEPPLTGSNRDRDLAAE